MYIKIEDKTTKRVVEAKSVDVTVHKIEDESDWLMVENIQKMFLDENGDEAYTGLWGNEVLFDSLLNDTHKTKRENIFITVLSYKDIDNNLKIVCCFDADIYLMNNCGETVDSFKLN
jgi:hypothetical protein